MRNIKTLTLAALAALSLGFGTAMAQESAGIVGGPYETAQLKQVLIQQAAAGNPSAMAAVGSTRSTSVPQFGSSDAANKLSFPVPVLQGGDGSGG
jgi:hypothetical protein